jgi:hypothetical protein
MGWCHVSGVVIFLLTAVALPLLLSEFGDWCPWFADRIVRWAAGHLGDPASCARYEKEWIANLNEVPGKLARLVEALGYLACTPSMRRSVRGRTVHSQSAAHAEADPQPAVPAGSPGPPVPTPAGPAARVPPGEKTVRAYRVRREVRMHRMQGRERLPRRIDRFAYLADADSDN